MATDFHAHIIVPEYISGLKVLGIDPLLVDGFALPNWSEQAHLEFMSEAGIDHAVLSSPTPHLWGSDEALTVKIHREVNSSICGSLQEKSRQVFICRFRPAAIHGRGDRRIPFCKR